MTGSISPMKADDDHAGSPRRITERRKRPRTAYLLYRRYRLFGRLAAALGGAAGLGLVAYSLLPAIAAGARVPPTTVAVAGIIVAGMALVPYSLVRWRWRLIKETLDD